MVSSHKFVAIRILLIQDCPFNLVSDKFVSLRMMVTQEIPVTLPHKRPFRYINGYKDARNSVRIIKLYDIIGISNKSVYTGSNNTMVLITPCMQEASNFLLIDKPIT